MKCPQCKETELSRNGHDRATGKQQYRCKSCGKSFNTDTAYYGDIKETPRKIGMTITEFREKHDVDYIVLEALRKLQKGVVYEKADMYALTGLRAGYPGLSAALENATEYRGRSNGTSFWGHPVEMAELKQQGLLT